jgi:F0F1-type ATP synthase assembly protein I
MVIPGILGYWVDRQLGTLMVFLVLGVVLGMASGMVHLIRFTKVGKPNGGGADGAASGGNEEDPNG